MAPERAVRNADDTATYPLVIAIRGAMTNVACAAVRLKYFLETAVGARRQAGITSINPIRRKAFFSPAANTV